MSIETFRPVPHPDTLSSVPKDVRPFGAEKQILPPRETEVLQLAALGLHNEEIGQQLSVTKNTVRAHMHHIFGKLGVDSREKAVILGINQGIVDLKQAASAFPIELMNNLKGKPREMVKEMAENGLSLQEVADSLGISTSSVKSHLLTAFRRLRVGNQIQAIVMYIAAQRQVFYDKPDVKIERRPPVPSDLTLREKEVLRFLGIGVSKKVANRMGISTRTLRACKQDIYRKLGVSSEGQAILWGIKNGIVEVEKKTEGFDISKANSLTAKEREILEKLIKSGFDYGQTASLSQISYHTLQKHVSHIIRKLNVEKIIQAGFVFMVWQKHPEIRDGL